MEFTILPDLCRQGACAVATHRGIGDQTVMQAYIAELAQQHGITRAEAAIIHLNAAEGGNNRHYLIVVTAAV